MMFDVLWPHLKLDVSHYQVDWISYHLFWNADCFDLKTHFIKYRILLRQCELSIWLLANDSISYSTVLFECNLHCCRVSWINITSEMNETLSFTLINCISISIISNLLHSTCWWISIKQCSKKKKRCIIRRSNPSCIQRIQTIKLKISIIPKWQSRCCTCHYCNGSCHYFTRM